MKITETDLRQIILEEIEAVLKEGPVDWLKKAAVGAATLGTLGGMPAQAAVRGKPPAVQVQRSEVEYSRVPSVALGFVYDTIEKRRELGKRTPLEWFELLPDKRLKEMIEDLKKMRGDPKREAETQEAFYLVSEVGKLQKSNPELFRRYQEIGEKY